MMAAAFRLFGPYSRLANWLILSIDCLFSAATAPAVYEIASRCFNRRVALWSGWLWALYPAAMQYAVKWVWEICLTTMLFSWALVLALRLRGMGDAQPATGSRSLRLWLGFGLLWGLIALSNPSLLLFLPVCGIWILAAARPLAAEIPKAALAALVFFACVAPWGWRNWQVFHVFIPMRDNLGAEVWYQDGPDALGFPYGGIVAAQPDIRELQAVGEVRYVARLGQKAKQYIALHPGHFVRLTIKRIYFFWVSIPHPLGNKAFLEYVREFHFCFLSITGWLGLLLALRRRVPASGLFLGAFLLLPITYYLVTVAARFRHPLEPLIAILTVYLFQSARPRAAASSNA